MISGIRSVFSVFEEIPILASFPGSGSSLVYNLEPTAYILCIDSAYPSASPSALVLAESALSGVYFGTIASGLINTTGQHSYVVQAGPGDIADYVGAFYRGVDNSIPVIADQNQEVTFNLAQTDILARNVVRGAVESMTIKAKSPLDTDFSNPVEQATIYFTYERPSITSDIVLKSPVAPSG